MTKEMPKGGKQSLEMMYRTCGIQINYDYTSEENFEKIFRLGNYLTPLTIALYSNSPFESYCAQKLNSNPWIVQPFEHYEEVRVEDLVKKHQRS
jgi:glutamate--cysteine ligase